MATTKMTRSIALALAIDALADNAEAVAVLTKMKAQVDKPATKSDVPTKSQRENAALDEAVLAWAKTQDIFTSTQTRDALGLMTWQKATKSLERLAAKGLIESTREKGKTLYRAI